jgi:amino acid adenylation domain-containing protein
MSQFLSLFQKNVKMGPDGLALISPEKTFSYGELNKASNQLAYELSSHIKKGERVAICLQEEPTDIIISILAILKLGCVYVPIDPKNPEERIQYLLQSVTPKITVCDNETKPIIEKLSPFFLFENFKDGKNIEQNIVISNENPAYIIFTSGSTGAPKGVTVSHRNLACIFSAWDESYSLKDINCHLQVAGYSFDVFSGDWIRALCSGATLVMSSQSALNNPRELHEIIETHGVECVEFLPNLLRSLMTYLEVNDKRLTTLKTLICGSDKWFASEYFKFKKFIPKHARLINSYGTSETTIDTSYFEFNQHNTFLEKECVQVPIGKAFPGVELLLLDDSYQEVTSGNIGEIYIGGCGVSLGYVNAPTLNKEKFVHIPERNGVYFKTGDYGKILSTGDIEFIGRHDGQVKFKGKRISLTEIENTLITHYAISEAVALIEDEKSQSLIVFIVADQLRKEVILENLKNTLPMHLPEYMIPDQYVVVSKLPTNLNGKIDRNRLKEYDK